MVLRPQTALRLLAWLWALLPLLLAAALTSFRC